MKKHTLYFATVLAALLLAGCRQENPESAFPSEVEPVENEAVIPARLEGVTPSTRVDIDGMTGIGAWSANDVVAVYADGTGFSRYKACGVVNGSVLVSLSSDQTRTNYAVYPYGSAVSDHHGADDMQVRYPTSYGVGLRTAAELETWTPTPMVAVNTETELLFYHVGALLRIHVTDVPVGTTSLAFKFVGIDNVTGYYTVSSPGTHTATVSLATGAGNTVTFTELHREEEMTFNIPLPTQDYSGLTALEVTAKGSMTITATMSLSGWSALGHGQGKQIDFDFTTITYPDGVVADGRFGDYYLSRGLLKWDDTLNGGAGGFTLTDGEDPLEVLQYGRATAETTPSINDIINVYYFRRFGDNLSLKYRCDGINARKPALQNRFVTVKGQTWLIPMGSEWLSMTSRPASTRATVNNSFSWSYVTTALDLTGTAYQETWGDTVYGIIIFPNNAIVSCPGIAVSGNVSSAGTRMISYRSLLKLLDGGCAFLPNAGIYGDGAWKDSFHYCAASNDTNADYYQTISGGGTSNQFGTLQLYAPARLIHN